MKINIRRANSDDARAMADLDRICFPSSWSEKAFKTELANSLLTYYLLVEHDEEIIAYGGLWEISGEGHITNFAVHPDHRRKGIGEKLLRELLTKTEERGINCHTLEVRVSNIEAKNLYEKLGFKIGGIRKEYYSDNLEDALILWREK